MIAWPHVALNCPPNSATSSHCSNQNSFSWSSPAAKIAPACSHQLAVAQPTPVRTMAEGSAADHVQFDIPQALPQMLSGIDRLPIMAALGQVVGTLAECNDWLLASLRFYPGKPKDTAPKTAPKTKPCALFPHRQHTYPPPAELVPTVRPELSGAFRYSG